MTRTRTPKYRMRLWEILCSETDATGLIKPVAPSKSRSDAYQNGPSKKRSRYQGGGNSRWQTPPNRHEATPSSSKS